MCSLPPSNCIYNRNAERAGSPDDMNRIKMFYDVKLGFKWNLLFILLFALQVYSCTENSSACILELFSDKSNTHEFVDLVKELALPGELTQNRSYDFEFMQVEKPYESYMGANVRLRYIH